MNIYNYTIMLSRYYLLIFVYIIFFHSNIYAEKVIDTNTKLLDEIKIYTEDNGLINNEVLCIDEDNNNILWIGTKKGLCKYDRKDFICLKPENVKKFEIWEILCDSKNNIWCLTTFNGIYRYNINSWEHIDEKKGIKNLNYFFDGFIFEDKKNNSIISGNLYDYFICDKEDQCETASFDEKKNIYYGIKKSELFYYSKNYENIEIKDKLNDKILKLKNQIDENYFKKNVKLWDIFCDEQKNLWLAESDNIIFLEYPYNNSYMELNNTHDLPKGDYFNIFQDRSGIIWFCTKNGLVKCKKKLNKSKDEYPNIIITNEQVTYYTEKNNKPFKNTEDIKLDPHKKIKCGDLSFTIKPKNFSSNKIVYTAILDDYNKKQNTYFPIEKKQNTKNFNFPISKDGKFRLEAKADSEDENSETIGRSFEITGCSNIPHTKIEKNIKKKFISEPVKICSNTSLDDMLFAYNINDKEWSEFNPNNCFIKNNLPTGDYKIQFISKKDNIIDPTPAEFTFSYTKINNLPFVRIDSKPESIIANDIYPIKYTFSGENDIENKKPLKFTYRLIPFECKWSNPSETKKEVIYDFQKLKDQTYVFMVKSINDKGFESKPEEHSFKIKRQDKNIYLLLFFCLLPIIIFLIFIYIKIKYRKYDNPYRPFNLNSESTEHIYIEENILEEIKRDLKENNILLYGEKMIGKTSILRKICSPTNKIFSSTHEDGINKDNTSKWNYLLFFCCLKDEKEENYYKVIIKKLKEKINEKGLTFPKENIYYHDKIKERYSKFYLEHDLFTIKEYLKKGHYKIDHIIMCIDNIDYIKDKNFINWLNEICEVDKDYLRVITTALSNTFPMNNFLNSSLFKQKPIDHSNNIRNLIEKPVKKRFSYEDDAFNFIKDKTNQKPFFINLFCKKIIDYYINYYPNKSKINKDEVEKIYKDLISSEIDFILQLIWDNLSEEFRKEILLKANEKDKCSSEVSKKDNCNIIDHFLIKQGDKIIDLFIIKKEDDKYFLTEFFIDWLNKNVIIND